MPKTLNKESAKYLLDRKIEEGTTFMAPKKPPGNEGIRGVKLHLLDLTQKLTVHRYEVNVSGTITKQNGDHIVVGLTDATQHDYLNVDRRYLCRDVLKTFEKKYEEMLKTSKNLLYYDLSHTLFALKDLRLPNGTVTDSFTCEEMPRQTVEGRKHFPQYTINITSVTAGGGQMTIGDFAFLTNDVGELDLSLVQFLDIATAQTVFNDPNQLFMHYSASSIYLMMPAKFGFNDNDCPYFPSNSSFLGIGMEKSVRIVENGQTKAGASAAVIIQVQKTPFHIVESVFDKFKKIYPRWQRGTTVENGALQQLNRMLRGLYIFTVYPANDPQARQRFAIYGFATTNAKTEKLLDAEGMQCTIEEYYDRRYRIKLEEPTAPLVIRREKGKTSYYPMELMTICDYQRVRSHQQTPALNQDLIKKCAVKPSVLREQTEKLKKASKICSQRNRFLFFKFRSRYLIKAQFEIEEGTTFMAPKKPPGNEGIRGVKVTTNLHLLDLTQKLTVHRYEVNVSGTITKQNGDHIVVGLTDATQHDYLNVDRRYLCRDVLKTFEKKYEEMLKTSKNLLYYDLSHTLFALKDLRLPNGTVTDSFTCEEMPRQTVEGRKHFPQYTINITSVTAGGGQMTIGDFAFLTNDVGELDLSLVQFLDIATAQTVFNDPNQLFMHYSASSIYLMMPAKFGFNDNDCPYFPSNSSFLGIGMEKSVRIVENGQTKAGASAAVIIQVQKTPFHIVESVFDKFKKIYPRWQRGTTVENGALQQLNRMLRGLYIFTVYPANDPQARQRFAIYGFATTNAKTEKLLDAEGMQCTIEEYYDRRYRIKLEEPTAPLVIRREKGKTSYYPMELMTICDYQRVRSHQQTPALNQDLIKKCAVKPSVLREQTEKLKSALDLGRSEHLERAAIKFDDRPMEVESRILRTPEMNFGDQSARPGARPGRYLIAAKCLHWCAIALVDNSNDNYYFELKTEVISQGVLISTVRAVLHKGNPLTVENIVNKTNIKNGGLNYALPFSKNMLADTLVIGFGMNHPAGGLGMASEKNNGNGNNGSNGSDTGSEVASENGNGGNNGHSASKPTTEKSTPSVVGYAANIGENHNFEFIGDYKYQEARRDEKLHLVEHIVCRCLDEYKRREKKYPSSVVIYRNACGEGFYQHILTYDVPLIKSLLKEHCTAKLTMIVVNKMQGIKFIPSNINVNAKAIEQNVKPGTVIDKSVVSPQWTEFFLAAQRALQGTARVPRYALLLDENNYSMDKIQEFTFGLCFGHQIVFSPTSLPSPVFIALEYAKRGRNNYNTDQNPEAQVERWVTYDSANENFGFEQKKYLRKWRVNA
uniref:PAZ domain-containing protein n=1 Tax=Globodera pallida TaxID=36090 RepID=A0A183BNY3_GLOPA